MEPAQAIMIYGLTTVFVLKLVCFVLGFLVVRIGAGLLRDGITGSFTFKTELNGAKADLASASPGLLFVLLGVALIGYAMWVAKDSSYRETPGAPASAPPDVPLPTPAAKAGP